MADGKWLGWIMRGEVRLAGLEPTASAFAGLRSIQLSYKRAFDGHDHPHI